MTLYVMVITIPMPILILPLIARIVRFVFFQPESKFSKISEASQHGSVKRCLHDIGTVLQPSSFFLTWSQFSCFPADSEEKFFIMPKEKCSDCEQLKVFKEVLLSTEALKPKLDRCLKVSFFLQPLHRQIISYGHSLHLSSAKNKLFSGS